MNFDKKLRHFIAMSGLRGCIPTDCEVFDDWQGAVDYLGDIFELDEDQRDDLREDCYLDLILHRHGADYCEIEECDCVTPEIHSDSGV